MSVATERRFYRQRYGSRIIHLAKTFPSGPVAGCGPGSGSARCGEPLDIYQHEDIGPNCSGTTCAKCWADYLAALDEEERNRVLSNEAHRHRAEGADIGRKDSIASKGST